ncbi:MAG: Exonuclease SbcC [Nitrosopumilales archaeon]|nr:MAG: Exonuclease SbcC [Nitrosopumilales archaeon]
MSDRTNLDFELFCRALQHYSQRMTDLKEDEEIKNGNNILKQDLEDNSKLALEVADLLIDYHSNNVTSDHVELIKSALELYKDDLLVNSESLKKKLKVEISLKNLDDEIRNIDRVMRVRDWV